MSGMMKNMKYFFCNALRQSAFEVKNNTVLTAQYCRQLKTVFASAKTLPLFLKRREGCGERGKNSFLVK